MVRKVMSDCKGPPGTAGGARLRIDKAARRTAPVVIFVDERPLPAFIGETVATALLASGLRAWRYSPRTGTPRGLFCAMGICQECVVRIDGKTVTACTEPVRDGMHVTLERASHDQDQ